MARIRTIKPEFFTSEDIVELSAFARLLYIALWCEADRAGRMQWKPRTFKMRYFPADDIDINALCAELIDGGLVVVYGDGLAYIPKFEAHQHINPRESASTLPDPHASSTRRHASARVIAPSVTHREEGKGKEGVEDASPSAPPTSEESSEVAPQGGYGPDCQPEQPGKAARGTRLPADWKLPKAWGEWALKAQPTWTPEHVRWVADQFGDWWRAQSGRAAVKLDWEATWRVWVRKEPEMRNGAHHPVKSGHADIFAGCE